MEINLEAFGIGVGIKGIPPISDIEEALIRMLKGVKKNGKRILITVDEVTSSKDIRIFASAYQIFLREGLPVFLLMTGLFKNIDRLRNADGMTFLERAPRTSLSPLNISAIEQNFINTLGIKPDIANRLARLTKGYSFAFQTLGYFLWENPDNLDKAKADAKDYLFEFAYWKIWSELSENDKKVLQAISQVPTGEILQIRKLLNYSSNQFNPYRDRLLKAGAIISPGNGVVETALPWFGDFVVLANSN